MRTITVRGLLGGLSSHLQLTLRVHSYPNGTLAGFYQSRLTRLRPIFVTLNLNSSQFDSSILANLSREQCLFPFFKGNCIGGS